MEWSNEQELVTIIHNELFTAVIGDILDDHGYRHQFLPPNVRPLSPSMKLVGRAMPVLEADVYDTRSPYGLIFEALDALQPGEIYIAAGASSHYARGAVGAVINGSIRDVSGILSFEQFPVFCTGITGQDQKGRGRAIDYRVPVQIGGVMIEPGAMIIGDMDGVVVVPKAVEESVFTRSLAKARTEKTIKKDLENGMLATIAFKKYGIM
jgi:regulator of RNase E activity RraA